MINLSNIGKFLVAVAGAAGVLISNGLVPQQYLKYVTGPIAAVTALGVYFIKNGPTTKEVISAAASDAVAKQAGRENVT